MLSRHGSALRQSHAPNVSLMRPIAVPNTLIASPCKGMRLGMASLSPNSRKGWGEEMANLQLKRRELTAEFRKSPYSRKARERRYRRICQLVGLRPHDRVLDVGCGRGSSFEDFNRENEIVGLDIDPVQRIFQDNFRFVRGDAAFMGSFKDGEFDVVVCIGVLPRVTPYASLRRAAGEIARVGKAFAVVVPHMFTFIEPYSQLPLWQFSPRNFRAFSRRWDWLNSEKKTGSLDTNGEKLFYLRARDWQALFPGAMIVSHSHLAIGLLRDLIIFKGQGSAADPALLGNP